MKFCPNCRISYDDNANVCAKCGEPLMVIPQAEFESNPADHTAQFDPADVADNKVFAMIAYITSVMGVIIALLAGFRSPYAAFHARQALKIDIAAAVSALLCLVPILGWLAFAVWMIITLVVKIICFIYVCQGKAMEPPIISKIGFLK